MYGYIDLLKYVGCDLFDLYSYYIIDIVSGIDLDFVCKGSENIGRRQVCESNVHVFAGIIIDNVAVVRILYR